MKKLYALILIVLASLAAGCLTSDSGNDKNNEASGSTYTITGKVVNSSGAGISGVSITLTGATAEKSAGENVNLTVSTNSAGSYTFQDVKNGSYVVAAYKSGLKIEPSSRTVQVSGSNVTVPDFTESADTNDGGGNGGNTGDGGTGSGDAGSHTFFPLKKGATWTYHVKDTDVVNNSTDEYDYTSSISGTKVVNGKEYWVMVDENDEFDSYLRIEGGVVYVYGENEVFAKIPKMLAKAAAAGKEAEDISPFDSEIPMVDLNAGIGQTFNVMDYNESNSGMSMTMKMSGKYIGNKNINTPAGTFNNCRQYELVTEYSISSEFYSTSSVTRTEISLAPNVGMIKSIDNDYEDNKLQWTYEEELTGYNIP